MRETLFHGIDVKSSPVKEADGHIVSGLINYSIELVINGTHFFSAWKMGTEQQQAEDLARIDSGVLGVTRVRTGTND